MREKLNTAILGVKVEEEPELEKLYRLPKELNLTAVMYLQRRIAEKAGKLSSFLLISQFQFLARHFIAKGEFGSSLCWAIRANNDSICSEVLKRA